MAATARQHAALGQTAHGAASDPVPRRVAWRGPFPARSRPSRVTGMRSSERPIYALWVPVLCLVGTCRELPRLCDITFYTRVGGDA